MNTKNNQKILLVATALFIVAGLLVIPAVDNQDANGAVLTEKLQKAQEKIQKSLDKVREKLGGHDIHS